MNSPTAAETMDPGRRLGHYEIQAKLGVGWHGDGLSGAGYAPQSRRRPQGPLARPSGKALPDVDA